MHLNVQCVQILYNYQFVLLNTANDCMHAVQNPLCCF